ncbi:MAG TPA: hypothetical protein VGO06_13660 [Bosea sp. (in: a-proteobacteria)]|uniref:hypothetical protein n=1 Tax=Bosea sp. (in: a-proteobacteria) TaxID=1871050 RepID=UPI002E11FAF2|nr:hypothetical protein [Bosea sp. (in: a-proteobacteria)]
MAALSVSISAVAVPARVARTSVAVSAGSAILANPLAIFGPIISLAGSSSLSPLARQIHVDGTALAASASGAATPSRLARSPVAIAGSATTALDAIRIRPGKTLLTGRAILEATPTTAYADLVTNTKVQLVYTVELYPWAVSDRMAA